MAELINQVMEEALVKLVNKGGFNSKTCIDNYQVVNLWIYDQNMLNAVLKECKYKDFGNVFDYEEELPQPRVMGGMEVHGNFDMYQRIGVSKKFKSVVFYSADAYSIACSFIVDTSKLKKFLKIVKPILKQDTGMNIFRNTDFSCADNEYIEICASVEDKTKQVDVAKRKVPEENLVFDDESTINEVMGDISTFFEKKTEDLYERLQLTYKRGIILYGDPGNGKSAMIRQIIRTIPNLTKIIINPNVGNHNVTKILQSLTKALNGKHAMIVIEDIDSLITDRNRSEFLNILDGVDVKSGAYFMGTTNYPDRIDPAFMNRSGRFDRTYKINNPSEGTRRLFFTSRKIGKLLAEYKVFKDDSISDTDDGVVELFVKNTHDLPMASLKEMITSTSYLLACNNDMTIEEAVEKTFNTINGSREEHAASHNAYLNKMRGPGQSAPIRLDDDDDEF